MTRDEYVKRFAAFVLDSVRGTGLFPSVVMAQALLESSNKFGEPGQSLLARKYNNHFGIKADKSWKGKAVNISTGEVFNGEHVMIKDNFRVYDKPEDGFEDRNRFLIQNPRYTKAGVFKAATPEEQAEALQAAGYATDPTYAKKIKILIATHKLKDLDRIAEVAKN